MHLDHIGVSVRDLEAQADWYERAFGFHRSTTFALAALQLRGAFISDPEGNLIELLDRTHALGA